MIDSNASDTKKLSAAPKSRVCYICGRLYGLTSYEIHLKQCKDLWVARENAKPDPRERKALPQDPALQIASRKKASKEKAQDGDDNNEPTEAELEEINRIASEAYNTTALSVCAFCGRSFLPGM